MRQFFRDAVNLATMRAETKIRAAHLLFGDSCFHPEQLVDGGAIVDMDMALLTLRRLEDDGKVNITLTVRVGETITYEGNAPDFIAMGDPDPTAVISIRADMTTQWVREVASEMASYLDEVNSQTHSCDHQ